MGASGMHVPGVLYQPDSQDSARYSVVPWQRIEIIIGQNTSSPDRSQGVLIEGIEGEGMIVERADWPVLMAPVTGQAAVAQALMAARDGIMFDAPFRGLYLAHPILTTGAASLTMVLSIIVFKRKGALVNQLAQPIARSNLQVRTVTNNATTQFYGVYVPAGVRQLNKLIVQFTLAGAPALTQAIADLRDKGGQQIIVPNVSQQLGAAVQTYGAFNANYPARITLQTGIGNTVNVEWNEIPIPTGAAEVLLQMTAGAGLTTPVGIQGYWS